MEKVNEALAHEIIEATEDAIYNNHWFIRQYLKVYDFYQGLNRDGNGLLHGMPYWKLVEWSRDLIADSRK